MHLSYLPHSAFSGRTPRLVTPLRFLIAIGVMVAWSPMATNAIAQTISFQRDIQPILAEKCWHCHGADASTRQGGLRLDNAQDAVKGGDSGPAFIAGEAGRSRMIARIESSDADEVMPPPKENKPLSAAEKKLLAQWINEGAVYDQHWAFQPPVKRPLPATPQVHAATLNPIDAWVQDRLQRQHLSANPQAPDYQLCRRLYLDIIGLPPTPTEILEYKQVGHDATVRKLLASPRYGEKWARHWLDAARYSDTNGYEKDLQRDQWIWRDWVVQALNADMPYDQFIIEQIAGDLLPGATQDQVVATGFLRNSMLNEEGAIVPEQFRMVEMFDRMDCIGKSILGLSTQCAQCHAHKFDPISQSEYYGMFAFLNNTHEAQSWVYTPEQQKTIAATKRAIDEVVAKCQEKVPNWSSEVAAWGQSLIKQRPEWRALEFHDLGSNSGLNHPVQLNDGSVLMLGHTSGDVFMSSRLSNAQTVRALQIEVLNHGDLPFGGPGRSRSGTWAIHEMELFVRSEEKGKAIWQKLELTAASADYSEAEVAPAAGKEAGKDAKEAASKKRTGPVAFLVDGSDDTTWKAERAAGLRNTPSVSVVRLAKPLELQAGAELKIAMRMGDMPGCVRFSWTDVADAAAPPVDHAAILALSRQPSDRTEEESRAITLAWIASRPELRQFSDEIQNHWKKIPNGFTSVLHLKQRVGDQQRATHFLDRGNWDQPKQTIEPHTPAAFHPLDATAPKNRLTFARWLVDRRSPLAARVAVNRIWQAIFGEGLVETSEDFGTRAPLPEHRELLDWLAVDFMDGGSSSEPSAQPRSQRPIPWSQKRLLELIVTSQTYKQSSLATEAMNEADPRNRWLARGPKFRVDAEVLRDMAMSVSGLITHKLGGPSVIPPVPQNVLDYNYVYPAYWKPATGPDRYRRTLYGFRKRSMPDPVMSNLDAPNGDLSCARRVRSNTPLAALTGLNEPIFFECAQALGMRVLREGGHTDASRIDTIFQLCLSRNATPAEHQSLQKLLLAQRGRLAEGWLNPREIITGDAGKLPDLPDGANPQDAAAWILAARVMLNLDETISKN